MRLHRSQVSQTVSTPTAAVDDVGGVPRPSKRFPARVLEPVRHTTCHVILPALLPREALPVPAAVQHPSPPRLLALCGTCCGLNVRGVYVEAVA